jgi:hypothetical protein
MQLFLPSVLLAILAIAIIFAVMPNFSPLVIVAMSAVILVAGTYHHFRTFWNEYQQSTWQNNLKLFAPGVMLVVILLYLFVAIGSFFTGGSVPVPSLPNTELPSAESATNPVTAAINSTMNTVNSAINTVSNSASSAVNSVANSVGLNTKNTSAKNNGITRSVLATV